jgi:hydroxyacylglutathione hydrolase
VKEAVLVDPGDEPPRLLDALASLDAKIEAILITHCHFDHVGAVAAMARATGAPVWCPHDEQMLLADINSFTLPGFGPFEGYAADHLLSGGERLGLAGLDIEVLATPGHSPGHLTYAVSAAMPADEHQPTVGDRDVALFSGDVLFMGSVGRVDLPGGDWDVLESSIATLVSRFGPQSAVYPGHMGATTLGRELDTNPFLQELRARSGSSASPAAAAPGLGSSDQR